MKGYLVWAYVYTLDDQLIGIFTDEAKALAYVDALPDFPYLKRYVLEDIDLPWSTGVAHLIEQVQKF